MNKKFSKKTLKDLDHYVYVYSDPDTGKPFYIGKGKNNRVFDHLSDQSETEKASYIKMLKENGKEPKIELLVHGIDDVTAKKVEAAAIDLLGINNLTNKKRGHESNKYGKIDVSLLESKYNYDELQESDFIDNTIIIKIGKYVKNVFSPYELYDWTRGMWKVNINEAKKVKYALSVSGGIVLEVYEIKGWFDAYSTFTIRENDSIDEGRYEFVGRIANDEVRKKFINKSVTNLYRKGSRNPIRYVWINK